MPVRQDVDGRVLVVTLDRPEVRNAVDADVARLVSEAIDRLEEDDHLWAGILAAEGPAFCAGADLNVVARGEMDSLVVGELGFAGLAERSRRKPLIAAVDGPAVAGGCELVLACDLLVVSRRATFGIPEVKRSLVAGAGGLFRLPRRLPRAVAMELVLTGDPLSAARAYALGLANELVEPGEALPAARRLAARICENAPIAVRESRAAFLAGVDAEDPVAWEHTKSAMRVVEQTSDFLEGPRAFIEKRPPVWTGR